MLPAGKRCAEKTVSISPTRFRPRTFRRKLPTERPQDVPPRPLPASSLPDAAVLPSVAIPTVISPPAVPPVVEVQELDWCGVRQAVDPLAPFGPGCALSWSGWRLARSGRRTWHVVRQRSRRCRPTRRSGSRPGSRKPVMDHRRLAWRSPGARGGIWRPSVIMRRRPTGATPRIVFLGDLFDDEGFRARGPCFACSS